MRSLSTALKDPVPMSRTRCSVMSPSGQIVFSMPAEPRRFSRSSSLVIRGKNEPGFGMVEQQGQLVLLEQTGQGDGNRAGLEHTEVEGDPVGRVRSTKTDAVPRSNPHFDQPCCYPIGAVIELPVAHLNPGFANGRPVGKRNADRSKLVAKFIISLLKKSDSYQSAFEEVNRGEGLPPEGGVIARAQARSNLRWDGRPARQFWMTGNPALRTVRSHR